MKKAFRVLRTWFRSDRNWLRRPIHKTKPRLSVELLEERLAPAGDFRSVIGLDAVQSMYPYRGSGYTIAVLDTGIDYRNVDLGGGFGAGHRVVAGYDFINNRADPMDDNGHGTHVAGIIGSSNPSSPGIAPDVHFVALKVLDANLNGTWTAVDNALQWVISHKTQYNIVGVNLSLGSDNYTSSPYSFLDNDFTTLKNLGVFTAAASGNQYYTFHSQPGLNYPAVSPYVVSVGATWAANAGPVTFSTGASESNPTVDHIVSFTQRSSALSLLAPGAWITSTWLGGATQVLGGTSMATAVVSGAAVLLHQACDQTGNAALATQVNLLNIMQTTGVTIVDVNYGTDNVAHTGLSFKRLNHKAALDTIAPLTLAAIPDQVVSHNQDARVSLIATNGGSGVLTYSARVLPVNGQAPPIQVTLQGNQLTLHATRPIIGTFVVAATVSNGTASATRTFNLTLTNSPPTLGAVSPQTMARGQTSLTIALQASDPDNDALTFQAVARTPDASAYQLNQQYAFQPSNATYYFNLWGYNEKWLIGRNNQWYALLPNGKLYHWSQSIAQTLTAANLIATLDPKFYTEPRLLWNANPPSPPALTFSFQGNQLTIRRPATLTGVFFIDVTVSDGFVTVTRTIQVTLN